jgi:hydrogenase nickel incorporation protein HypA/HybF
MHELSVADSMFSIIEEKLGGAYPLTVVAIVLGPLSGVSPDSLEFCLGEIARERGFGTPVARITIRPARVQCAGCGEEYALKDLYAPCPSCGGMERSIISGHECYVDSVELEEADV